MLNLKYLLLFSMILLLGIQNCYAELRDPTRPPNYVMDDADQTNPQKLTVHAIIVGPKRQVAIINGQSVQIGDTIAGFKVLEIKPQAIRLQGPSGITIFPLLQQDIKIRSKQRLPQ